MRVIFAPEVEEDLYVSTQYLFCLLFLSALSSCRNSKESNYGK